MKSNARFLLSRINVLEQYKLISRSSDIVSYSFKTNKEVGLFLRDNTDCMFSIHVPDSIDMLGCPERIWFIAQAWEKTEIKEILDKDVRNFVVDNINDLDPLLKFLKENKIDNEYRKVNLLLRMRLKEKTVHTGKHYVFGMFSGQVKELIPELRKNQLIDKLGIHFHRKTQNISEWSLKYELEDVLTKDILEKIDYINIGGGIPSQYKNFRAEVLENIFGRIKELKKWLKPFDIKMMIEPGRFIAAPAVKLEAEIMNIYDNNIVVNCSIYNGAMDTFVSHIRLKIEGELPDGRGQAYTIKGRTPDSIDIFRYRVFLKDPKIGDKIVFLNAGAYTYSTDFCGLEKLKTEIVE